MDGNFQPSDVIADDFDIRRIALAMAIEAAGSSTGNIMPLARDFEAYLRGGSDD
jgi:hypothetical protein